MFRRARAIPLLAAFVVMCFALTSCDLFAPKGSPSSESVVGDNGADLTVAGVHIVVPAGAAPVGTKVEASFEDREPTGTDGDSLQLLAKAFKIKLGDNLQPSKPLTVTVPVDKTRLASWEGIDTAQTVVMLVQSEGASEPDLVSGVLDPDAGTVTAQVPHLSLVWPAQLDLGAVMKKVGEVIDQGFGIKFPKPDCVDKSVTIAGSTYKAVSPAQAWLCVGDSNGSLTITASANSPIPFLSTTLPAAAASNKVEISAATAFSVALAQNSGFIKNHQSIMMPGADAQYTFNGTPGPVRIGFKQYPVMLLMSILSKVFDTALGSFVKAKALDDLAKAGCMQNIVDTADAGSQLTVAYAGGIVKSFFGCVGTAIKLSPAAQILLAIITAGPQFLAASAMGIYNEFSGGANFESTITASAAPASGTMEGATRFVTLDPWKDGTLKAVSKTYDGSTTSTPSCNGSEIAPRKDGFRCYWPGIFDPCFQSPTAPRDFLCLTVSPDAKSDVTLLKNMKLGDDIVGLFQNTGAPEASSAVRVELVDGTVCSRSTGAGPKGVPGYPYWAGHCFGPSEGVWRVSESDQWTNDLKHYPLYPPTLAGGYWQVAISPGNEEAPARRFDVKTVYR
ncbi:hypothetical protein [Paenarthrobacter sp. YJN-5]|uniref:hypothetical protein n=1 Tax=Paenarthrobacter sp. YJN-5 TaxID=2735316 RepID=UPI0018782086|nr:hypothetical protein [Paenarthrobacter sp. YJN-5]QOT19328.1 hypothetical protein HMI59_21975 [Paenarthrobacter sp. YJN-5]